MCPEGLEPSSHNWRRSLNPMRLPNFATGTYCQPNHPTDTNSPY